jgi:hypothetical protein
MNTKYTWPASSITPDEMALLYHARLESGKPIVELLRLAIHLAYAGKQKRRDLDHETHAETKRTERTEKESSGHGVGD